MQPTAGKRRVVSPPSGDVRLAVLSDGEVLAVSTDADLVLTARNQPDDAFFSILDRDADRWRSAGTPAVTGREGSVTPLADGRVLLVGGIVEAACPPPGASTARAHVESCFAALSRADLWDPRTSSFETASPLKRARFGHAAIRLDDGRVLVVGGWSLPAASQTRGKQIGVPREDATALDTTEIFDSATNRWVSGPPLHSARADVAAQQLEDGRILIVGSGGAEVLDPRQGTSSVLPGAPAWTRALVVPLAGDRALAIGLVEGSARVQAAVHDPRTSTWSDAPGLIVDRPLAAVRLKAPDMRVAIVQPHSIVLWDPERGTSVEDPLTQVRDVAAAAVLPDGRVLVAGGATYEQTGAGGNDRKCLTVGSAAPPELWRAPPVP